MSFETILTDLTVLIATHIKALKLADGDLSTLNTTAKNSLVAALNELQLAVSATGAINDSTSSPTTVYSSTKVIDLIDTSLAALVDSSPTTLNTLNELAAALGDDPNFATTVATSLSKKVGVLAQTFTEPEKSQARTNIDVPSTAVTTALQTQTNTNTTNIATLTTNVGDSKGIVISSVDPFDGDGRPNGTIYLYTGT